MPSVRNIPKRLLDTLLQPVARWYLSKDRIYQYKNLKLLVKAGVFHPGLFFSTRILVDFLEGKDLLHKTLLELGAGSGLISFVAAQKGALVTASDISHKAIEGLQRNSVQNQISFTIVHSDLFDHIPPDAHFDFIIINPPYYPRNPTTEEDNAWFCGNDFQYFKKLFQQLHKRIAITSATIYMILSEDCQMQAIEKIALANGFEMKLLVRKKALWEWNFIFSIIPIAEPKSISKIQ